MSLPRGHSSEPETPDRAQSCTRGYPTLLERTRSFPAFTALSRPCGSGCVVAEGARFELARPEGLPVFKTGAIDRSANPPIVAETGRFELPRPLARPTRLPTGRVQPLRQVSVFLRAIGCGSPNVVLNCFGLGTRTRTRTDGVRIHRSTVKLFPIMAETVGFEPTGPFRGPLP